MLKSLFPIVTKRHVERKILHTPPRHLFRIIEKVDEYSQFLPLCSFSKVLRRDGNHFDATLTVGLPPLFSETYTSRVRVSSSDNVWTVHTKSIESSLFESLESRWTLKPAPEHHHISSMPSCDVDFWVEMSVSDPVVAQALDRVLQEVAGRQVAAFEKRCREIPIRDEDLGLSNQ
jgi:coenzyme Q-binding protein COQ10